MEEFPEEIKKFLNDLLDKNFGEPEISIQPLSNISHCLNSKFPSETFIDLRDRLTILVNLSLDDPDTCIVINAGIITVYIWFSDAVVYIGLQSDFQMETI